MNWTEIFNQNGIQPSSRNWRDYEKGKAVIRKRLAGSNDKWREEEEAVKILIDHIGL